MASLKLTFKTWAFGFTLNPKDWEIGFLWDPRRRILHLSPLPTVCIAVKFLPGQPQSQVPTKTVSI